MPSKFTVHWPFGIRRMPRRWSSRQSHIQCDIFSSCFCFYIFYGIFYCLFTFDHIYDHLSIPCGFKYSVLRYISRKSKSVYVVANIPFANKNAIWYCLEILKHFCMVILIKELIILNIEVKWWTKNEFIIKLDWDFVSSIHVVLVLIK